jgi:hypothetical protein
LGSSRALQGSLILIQTKPHGDIFVWRPQVIGRKTNGSGPAEGGLFGEGEGVPVAFQNGATHEHVHNLCAHVRSESPKTLCLPDGQTEARHFLKLGADTDSKMLNIHLCDAFLQLIDG